MNRSDQLGGSGRRRDHPASLEPGALSDQCKMRTTRGSGPGGQNRNKVETAVILTHGPSGLTAQASERRSQAENRAVALKRLRLELALSIRLPIEQSAERLYEPSSLWVSRCRGGRIVVSPDHDDFAALLAEALDVLQASGFEPKIGALALGCSASQLIKLVKEAPRALEWINEERRQKGQHSLK
jgi:hypothetical protein